MKLRADGCERNRCRLRIRGEVASVDKERLKRYTVACKDGRD